MQLKLITVDLRHTLIPQVLNPVQIFSQKTITNYQYKNTTFFSSYKYLQTLTLKQATEPLHYETQENFNSVEKTIMWQQFNSHFNAEKQNGYFVSLAPHL